MVIVLDEAPSFGSQIGRALGQGAGAAIGGGAAAFANSVNRKKENEFLENVYELKLSGIKNPKMRKALLQSALRSHKNKVKN